MKKIIAILIVLGLIGAGGPAFSQVPQYMQFQGKVTNADDEPLTGAHSLTFRIYDALEGGSLIWNETHPSVDIQNGIFSVMLGGVTPLDAAFDEPYWISIEVETTDGANEMPRQAITSVGYAYRAKEADYAAVAESVANPGLSVSKAVSFDPSMTAAEIQALINEQPKHVLRGANLVFQFEDGTYNLDSYIEFCGFHGGGNIFIQGNPAESGAHTNQAVHLDFSQADCHGIFIRGCNANGVMVYNLKVTVDTSISRRRCLYVTSSRALYVRYNYFRGTNNSKGYGVYTRQADAELMRNYFDNVRHAICTFAGCLMSNRNFTTGTSSYYGLYAAGGGVIGKHSTQPTGTVANEITSIGGEIR